MKTNAEHETRRVAFDLAVEQLYVAAVKAPATGMHMYINTVGDINVSFDACPYVWQFGKMLAGYGIDFRVCKRYGFFVVELGE